MLRKYIVVITAILLALALPFAALGEYTELRQGSKDGTGVWSVYSLQMQLKELGYLTGTADGVYGAGTAKAVKAFQTDHGLEATGVATVETQEALFAINASPTAEDGTSAEPTEEPRKETFTTTDINIVQGYLYKWGFTTSKADGKFGSETRSSMAMFQKYAYDALVSYLADLEASATPAPTPEPSPTPQPGEMGMIADVAIEAEPEIPTDGTLTHEWFKFMESGFDPSTGEVALGDKGTDVLRMQNRLFALGYIAGGNDGGFGDHTLVALKYFQRRNGLEETGIFDADTQTALFSSNAVTSDKYVSMYMAMVSVKDQRVYIYQWTGGDYTELIHTFKCSTGTVQNPTILGTFQAPGRNGEWYYMEDSKVWVRYAFVIQGGYFFHSVLYKTKDSQPTSTSIKNLGTRASHGCIRLAVDDVKWIYDNCANGMTVTIYED